ncbi:MAG: copper resistance protein B [Croceibacterium sp.]
MRKLATALAAACAFALAVPAAAQDHSMQGMQGMNMPGMTMPMPAKKKAPAKKPAPKRGASKKPPAKAPPTKRKPRTAVKRAQAPTAPMPGMDHGAMPGMTMPAGSAMPAPSMRPSMPGMVMPAEQHSAPGMAMGSVMPGAPMDGVAQTGTALAAGNAPAPPVPTDHAADRVYDADAMMMSRHHLQHHHGGGQFYQVMVNMAEYQVRKGRDGYNWDGEAWYGGDINRLWLKSEGEADVGRKADRAEVQALFSRTIDPYFNLQGGVRYDLAPNPSRAYASIGIEGLAPSFFEVEAFLFLSTQGDLLARLGGYYDQRITQRLILQPRAELNFAAQDVPETGVGAGLSDAELGLRLRYDIRREFAPYVGVEYQRAFGKTADYHRAAGEAAGRLSFLMGLRTWF